MNAPIVEHIVARKGRTYRVLVPESVVQAGADEVERHLDDEIARQDAARQASEAAADAAQPVPGPSTLAVPDEE